MPYYILYTALLLAGCFFAGAWLACLTRKAIPSKRPALATAAAGAGSAALTAREMASTPDAGEQPVPTSGLFGDRDAAEQAEVDQVALADDGPIIDPQPSAAEEIMPSSDATAEPVAEPEGVHTSSDDAEVGDEPTGSAAAETTEPASAETPEPAEADASPAPDTEEISASVSDDDGSGTPDMEETQKDVADASESVSSAVAAATAAAAAAVAAARASAADVEASDDVGTAGAASETNELPSPDIDDFDVDAFVAAEADGPVDDETFEAGAPAPDVDKPEIAEDSKPKPISLDDPEPQNTDDVVEPAVSDDDAAPTAEPIESDEATEANAASDSAGLGGAIAAGLAGAAAVAAAADDTGDVEEVAVATPVVDASSSPDDLTRIKGIDAETSATLNDIGITTYRQIADLDAAGVARVNSEFARPARVSREGWIEQAALLGAGRETFFSGRQSGRARSSIPLAVTAPVAKPEPAAVEQTTDDVVVDAVVSPATAVTSVAAAGAGAALSGNAASVDATDRDGAMSMSERGGDDFTSASQDQTVDNAEPETTGTDEAEADADAPTALRDRLPRSERVDPERDDQRFEGGGQRSTWAERQRARRGRREDRDDGRSARSGGGRVLSSAPSDDLKRIRGIGVVIEKKLNAMGVYSYEQIAGWGEQDIAAVNDVLDFKGRIENENWIAQAKLLAETG
ncbi:MAG: hypothetical protein AAFZ01_11970 [Pseudomonadota bacterium]